MREGRRPADPADGDVVERFPAERRRHRARVQRARQHVRVGRARLPAGDRDRGTRRRARSATRAKELKARIDDGIAQYGTVDHPTYGRVYAYEVDGSGEQLLMDDANMPSLLSMPMSGFAAPDDPTYLATRSLLLSPENPYYYSGTHGSRDRQSAHPAALTSGRSRWPSRASPARRRRSGSSCSNSCATPPAVPGRCTSRSTSTTRRSFTREWFSWANAMFCELALVHAGRTSADVASPGGDDGQYDEDHGSSPASSRERAIRRTRHPVRREVRRRRPSRSR